MIMFSLVESWVVRDKVSAFESRYDHYVKLSQRLVIRIMFVRISRISKHNCNLV